jgi:hypothetical protein
MGLFWAETLPLTFVIKGRAKLGLGTPFRNLAGVLASHAQCFPSFDDAAHVLTRDFQDNNEASRARRIRNLSISLFEKIRDLPVTGESLDFALFTNYGRHPVRRITPPPFAF